MKKLKLLWIFILSVISFFFSWLVYFQHRGSAALDGVCNAIGAFGQCDIVGASSYAKLFGLDNSILGIIGFGVMVYLSAYSYFYKPSKLYGKLMILGSFISGVLAIFFIYLQAAVIGAYCIYCLVVDAASIGLLIIAVASINWKKLKVRKA